LLKPIAWVENRAGGKTSKVDIRAARVFALPSRQIEFV
jgi:hypothetical protein